MDVTRVYLVRHAYSVWTPDEERPLSEAGAADARTVATLLSRYSIAAIYSSPSRRAVQTVTPLADQLSLTPRLVRDLRERALPTFPVSDFQDMICATWEFPDRDFHGESNRDAQRRAAAVVTDIVAHHPGAEVVVSTHGNLLALILNALDSRYNFDFWQQLTFPDIYCVGFVRGRFDSVQRVWEPAPAPSAPAGISLATSRGGK
jgi:2,3-bisphosphoglycerate-dependent phosphoglycerate mutase